MAENELPGMWSESDLSGGEADGYVRPPSRDLVRSADAAQYARQPIPEDDRGKIRVRLLNATPDPLGTVAAYIEMYKGNVIRDLSQVTDEMRRAALDEMMSTVLNGPLETVQFSFLVEGQTRSITHQQVRSRASFFAQESLRFAVPEGDWSKEIPLPPSLAGAHEARAKYLEGFTGEPMHPPASAAVSMLDEWEDAMINAQRSYSRLIELGMPAEEARDVLPHAMPTRLMWNVDLRTLLAEAGKRTCTQAQFPWRMIFAGVANELRRYGSGTAGSQAHGAFRDDHWQFREIANRIRPVCYQTGECGFMAKFDRSCNIRERVDAFAKAGVPSSEWSKGYAGKGLMEFEGQDAEGIPAISDAEWALNPAAARS